MVPLWRRHFWWWAWNKISIRNCIGDGVAKDWCGILNLLHSTFPIWKLFLVFNLCKLIAVMRIDVQKIMCCFFHSSNSIKIRNGPMAKQWSLRRWFPTWLVCFAKLRMQGFYALLNFSIILMFCFSFLYIIFIYIYIIFYIFMHNLFLSEVYQPFFPGPPSGPRKSCSSSRSFWNSEKSGSGLVLRMWCKSLISRLKLMSRTAQFIYIIHIYLFIFVYINKISTKNIYIYILHMQGCC